MGRTLRRETESTLGRAARGYYSVCLLLEVNGWVCSLTINKVATQGRCSLDRRKTLYLYG